MADGHELSHELLDLVSRWPADRPSILSYAFLNDDWDKSESAVPLKYRTRTLILILSDRSTCRLLLVPHARTPRSPRSCSPRPATRTPPGGGWTS